ncbi:MAG: flavin reductase family protein [Bacteroidota bacterium]
MEEKEYLTLNPQDLDNRELHSWLLMTIAPRPIGFVSSIDQSGNVNLSPFSYFNVFSVKPPVLIFSPSLTSKGAGKKDTHRNVTEVKEVVINVVNHNIVEQMSLASGNYQKDIDEFVKAGLTPLPSDIVKPPRVLQSPVSFECRVNDVIVLGSEAGSGNLVICEVLRMHIDQATLGTDGRVDPDKMDLVGRMGGSGYVRASGHALFEVSRASVQPGVGVDQLPRSIRNSHILTANNLGQLGTAGRLPSKDEVQEASVSPEVHEIILEYDNRRDEIKDSLHELGQHYLTKNQVHHALKILMVVDLI